VQVIVKFFGVDRLAIGVDQVKVELPDGADLVCMIELLGEKYNEVSFHPERTTYLVNQATASMKTVLNDGETVYVLHPLSGGCG
jgi:molybdopterin converting factor small subunit